MHNYNIIPILEEIEFKQHKHLQPHLIEKYSHFNKRKMYDMENCGHFLKFGLFQNLSDFSHQKNSKKCIHVKIVSVLFVLGEDLGSYLCKAIKFLTQYVKKKILDIFFNSYCTKSKIRRYSFNNFSYE